MEDSVFQEMVRKRLLEAMVNQGVSQKVLKASDVKRYISEGWGFVASLSNEKVIIKLPDNPNPKNYIL
jgi:hypothetical protein